MFNFSDKFGRDIKAVNSKFQNIRVFDGDYDQLANGEGLWTGELFQEKRVMRHRFFDPAGIFGTNNLITGGVETVLRVDGYVAASDGFNYVVNHDDGTNQFLVRVHLSTNDLRLTQNGIFASLGYDILVDIVYVNDVIP